MELTELTPLAETFFWEAAVRAQLMELREVVLVLMAMMGAPALVIWSVTRKYKMLAAAAAFVNETHG